VAQLLVGVVLVAVVALGLFGFLAFRPANSTPEFESLTDAPDTSLVGTVAYLGWEMGACLRVVPAAGGPIRTVTCRDGVNAGAGPELSWLDDGRVTVTFYGRSQKIIDVASGAVEDAPLARVPQVTPGRQPANISKDGRRLTSINDGGRVQILLAQNGTTAGRVRCERSEKLRDRRAAVVS
jgi:hypothetical protein